ncbi:CAP domain-containing protein [Reichenbachiella agarivorans]|uniref:CAP domain-containing protein n=1 Tax=Reichenbachiella agarivorans TaxID=2979464 RepID=A0ABY6CKF6_9BACT|nr:CAP domain-containing protein [Reichenbachiella agarivorans]UXP30874.1 CAP domain-containing protein [Reichenbachiella agarivorans]
MLRLLCSFLLILLVSYTSFGQKATTEEIQLIIERHNFWRTEVGVANIKYSDTLASIANTWAIALQKDNCAFKHSQNSYGENLFKGTVGYYTAGDAVDSWGAEKKDYSHSKNKCAEDKVCGHYTQIVWENTTEVGCAKSICDGNVIWVCNYNPPGNYVGESPY